jgi:hypothetical protein
MQCEDTSAQIADYLAGTLSAARRQDLETHAQSCPACREELERASQMWQLLDAVPADKADSRAMRARFNTLLAESELEQRRAAQPARRRWFGPWLQPLVACCAALLLVAVGIQIGRGLQPGATLSPPEVRELSREVRDLRQMVSLSLMQQQSASERLKGVSWSSQLDRPGDEVVTALIDTLMHDGNVNVRLASIDALKRFAERDVVRRAAVQALDTQKSPLVQMALIDFVVETQDHAALNALRRLSGDAQVNEAVRARAMWGIDQLEIA